MLLGLLLLGLVLLPEEEEAPAPEVPLLLSEAPDSLFLWCFLCFLVVVVVVLWVVLVVVSCP